MTRLTAELTKARQAVTSLQEKEESLQQLLATEKRKRREGGATVTKTGTLSSYDKRPAALVRQTCKHNHAPVISARTIEILCIPHHI